MSGFILSFHANFLMPDLCKVYLKEPFLLLQTVTEEVFEITVDEPEGCIVVATQSEPKCSVTIRMTSPAVREEPGDSNEQQGLSIAVFEQI